MAAARRAVASSVWEERFGEHAYGPLADAAFADALKQAGLTPDQVDVLVVAGTHGRAVRAFARGAGRAPRSPTTSRRSSATPARPSPASCSPNVLDRAAPGQTIALVVLADGATAVVLRTTDAIAAHRRSAHASPSRSPRATTRCATPTS